MRVEDRVFFAHRRHNVMGRGGSITPFNLGGATIAFKVDSESEFAAPGTVVVKFGYSLCSDNDNFDKAYARKRSESLIKSKKAMSISFNEEDFKKAAVAEIVDACWEVLETRFPHVAEIGMISVDELVNNVYYYQESEGTLN